MATMEARMCLERAQHKQKVAELLAGWKRAQARERELQETACELRETVQRLRDAEARTCSERANNKEQVADLHAAELHAADLHAEWNNELTQAQARERGLEETVQRLQHATADATKDARQCRDAMTNLRKAITEVVDQADQAVGKL